jgi:hypothetical protein
MIRRNVRLKPDLLNGQGLGWEIETVPSVIIAIASHVVEDCRAIQAARFRVIHSLFYNAN